MKSGGTATMTIIRQRDGGLKFTDVNSNVVVLRDPDASHLFDAITDLDA